MYSSVCLKLPELVPWAQLSLLEANLEAKAYLPRQTLPELNNFILAPVLSSREVRFNKRRGDTGGRVVVNVFRAFNVRLANYLGSFSNQSIAKSMLYHNPCRVL